MVRLGSGVAAGLVALTVGSCGGSGGGEEIGHLPWRLSGVSADARSVEITHVYPQCDTKAGEAVVREDARRVTIRVPEVTVAGYGDEVTCNASQTVGVESVKLAAPLGRRAVVPAPGASSDPSVEAPFVPAQPDASECARLEKLPAGSPARDVPWVADRLERCATAR